MQITPAGSGVAQLKLMLALKLPLTGEVEMSYAVAPPDVIAFEFGVASGALKSSPVPESAIVSGLVLDPL